MAGSQTGRSLSKLATHGYNNEHGNTEHLVTMFEFKGSLRHHGSYMHHLVLSINFLIRFVSLTSLVPFLLFIHLSGHLFQPHYFYYYSYHPIVPHLLWGELILHLFNKSFQAIIDVWYPADCIHGSLD